MEEKNSKIIKRNRVDEWSFFRNENGRICYSKQSVRIPAALQFCFQIIRRRNAPGKKGYMSEQNYKNFSELPLYMSVPAMAKLLGISESSGYELVHEKGFPAFKIGYEPHAARSDQEGE